MGSKIKVVGVQAKDIFVTLELPFESLQLIKEVIEMSEFNYDSENPEHLKIKEFLEEEYYPFIQGAIIGIEENREL